MACRSLEHLPVSYSTAEQRALAKFPMGGRSATKFFQSTFSTVQFLAATVERSKELKLYSPQAAVSNSSANADDANGDHEAANAKAAYVSTAESLARTRQELLWAFIVAQGLAVELVLEPDNSTGALVPEPPGPQCALTASLGNLSKLVYVAQTLPLWQSYESFVVLQPSAPACPSPHSPGAGAWAGRVLVLTGRGAEPGGTHWQPRAWKQLGPGVLQGLADHPPSR